ncbi:peroxiredoxin [Haliangium sp.]|uniref:peroxiredoxin n=1 Tax=Haliangium sp. TaxID=2663208 RepID=UPI003D14FAC4
MSIAVGDKFPAVKVKRLTDSGMEELDTGALVAGKKVVLFAVPGAYTPTCHKTHLPGYLAKADEIKAKGVDEIVCMAVNDPFVMNAWGNELGAAGKVTMLPDGNGELTQALGLEMDGSGAGLGTRSKRFSMTIEDGVVKSLDVEEKASEVTVSGADSCLAHFG